MKNRRNDKNPTDDPEDVTSWTLPSQVEADELQESSDFFIPPTSTSLGAPPDLEATLPSLPPPPPPPEAPAIPALSTQGQVAPAESWAEAVPSAEVREFPTSAKTTTPFRPDLPMPGAVIDLTSRTEHPYDDIYSLANSDSEDDADVTDDALRVLPLDLRSALQVATTPSLGLPALDTEADTDLSVLAAPPTAQASALAQIPSIVTVDVLGSDPTSFSGLFTDVLTDNGFDVVSVSETSILLTRGNGVVTIDLAEESAGCILEIVGLPVTAVKKLMLAGLLQIGFEVQASRTNEMVLRNDQKSLVRIVSV